MNELLRLVHAVGADGFLNRPGRRFRRRLAPGTQHRHAGRKTGLGVDRGCRHARRDETEGPLASIASADCRHPLVCHMASALLHSTVHPGRFPPLSITLGGRGCGYTAHGLTFGSDSGPPSPAGRNTALPDLHLRQRASSRLIIPSAGPGLLGLPRVDGGRGGRALPQVDNASVPVAGPVRVLPTRRARETEQPYPVEQLFRGVPSAEPGRSMADQPGR